MSEYTDEVDLAAELARDRFRAWRGVAVRDEGPLPDNPVDAMQIDLMRRSFVPQLPPANPSTSGWHLLAALGELFDGSEDADHMLATTGRVLVHAGQLAIANGLALEPILRLVPSSRDPNVGPACTPVGAVGFLAIVMAQVVKRDLIWVHNLVSSIATVVGAAQDHLEINGVGGERVDLLELYRIVGGGILATLPPYRSAAEILAAAAWKAEA